MEIEKRQEIKKEIKAKFGDKLTLNSYQLAQILGVAPATVENWRKQGVGVEYLEIGVGKKKRILYPLENVIDFLSRTVQIA